MRTFFLLILCLSFIFSCKTGDDTKDSRPPKDSSSVKKIPPERLFPSLEKKELFLRLFSPEWIAGDSAALWKPDTEELIRFENNLSDDGFCHTSLDTTLRFNAYLKENAVVIFTTYLYRNGVREECHPCAPMISIATFEKEENGSWRLDAFEKSVAQHGSFGAKDSIGLVQFGKDRHYLLFYGGYTSTGSSHGFSSFMDPYSFKEVLSFTDHLDNMGLVEDDSPLAFSYDVAWKVLSENPLTVELIPTGTMPDEDTGRVIPINETEVYIFSENTGRFEKECK